MSRSLVERDLGSVVRNPVKPHAAFIFRTTAGHEVPLSSVQRDKPCNKADLANPPLLSVF